MTYILEGEFTLFVDGRADQALKPGDWVRGSCSGAAQRAYCDKPGRALAHYVVEVEDKAVSHVVVGSTIGSGMGGFVGVEVAAEGGVAGR